MMRTRRAAFKLSPEYAVLEHTYSILQNLENSLRDGDVEQSEQ
jgi:hypothetical protein